MNILRQSIFGRERIRGNLLLLSAEIPGAGLVKPLVLQPRNSPFVLPIVELAFPHPALLEIRLINGSVILMDIEFSALEEVLDRLSELMATHSGLSPTRIVHCLIRLQLDRLREVPNRQLRFSLMVSEQSSLLVIVSTG